MKCARREGCNPLMGSYTLEYSRSIKDANSQDADAAKKNAALLAEVRKLAEGAAASNRKKPRTAE